METVLYIGNKNYSSWSLRPWLVLKWGGIKFREHLIELAQPGYGKGKIAEVLKYAPTGRVPCLVKGDLTVWDSLAIAEWAAEEIPVACLWPQDRTMRATARAVTAEMHSGFSNIRNDMSMNIKRRCNPQAWRPEVSDEIARIDRMWSGLREQHGTRGPWLFGQRSIADAFYAPVATRMRTYGIELSQRAQSYCDAVFADPDFMSWEREALPESWDRHGFSVIDGLYR